MKNDPQVYARFRPNRLILRKMNFEESIKSTDEEHSVAALDFACFLLRYNRGLDYQDFSNDFEVHNRIKRAEIFSCWADIESLANFHESLHDEFEKHRTTASGAFQEIYQYVEKSKDDLRMEFQLGRGGAVPSYAAGDKIGSPLSNHLNAPLIVKDDRSGKLHLEQTLQNIV